MAFNVMMNAKIEAGLFSINFNKIFHIFLHNIWIFLKNANKIEPPAIPKDPQRKIFRK